MSKRLHLITQSGQPYGSQRKCCERCGLSMYAMRGDEGFTEDVEEYHSPKEGWENCTTNPKPKWDYP